LAYEDLRGWIAALERAGELKTIRTEVDPVLEITEIADRVSKGNSSKSGGGSALLFQNVKGHPGSQVLINQFGSARRMNLALEVDTLDQVIFAEFTHVPAESLARQLVAAKQMNVEDSARFMALVAVGLGDALVAVFDAKYKYEFWRPITAIRNGDIDGNPDTEIEATWQPIDITPMHPEYPCAHCIQSGAAAGVIEAVFGTMDIPEVSMVSSTLPGVSHRWTNIGMFADEIANARIWAGFHYRFSARVGADMGRKIGRYVVETVMQPVSTDTSLASPPGK